jgi:hypothetical protein
MVHASRRHLTERYAAGVDLLLWETEKRAETGRAARRAEAAHRPATAADPHTARRPEAQHATRAAGEDASEQQP